MFVRQNKLQSPLVDVIETRKTSLKGWRHAQVSTRHVFCTCTSSADAKQLSLMPVLWCVLLTKEV